MNATLENAPCGYIRLSTQGTILAVNTTLADLIGSPKPCIERQPIQSMLPRAGQIFFQTHVFPLLQQHGKLEECYFELSAPTGKRIPVLANFSRVEADNTFFYDAIIMCVQKRHDLEETLVQTKIKTDEIIEELEQSNDSLGRFANMVAHDLKSPIRNMKRLSQFIVEDYADKLDDSGKDLLSKLESNSERAIHFIDKLLEYGSINSSSTLQKLDLNKVVQTACDTLSDTISSASATLCIGQLPLVMGLETQLVQLFQNLISNAIKYRDTARSPAITIDAEQLTPDKWRIRVKDNGIGIPEEYQKEIFGILYRLHGTDYEGAGIGLATCEWIIRNHSGTISVESKVGTGSQFYITLLSCETSNETKPSSMKY